MKGIGNFPMKPPKRECPDCQRYKEAAFRDAIEISKLMTALKIADDLISQRIREEREACAKLVEDHGHSNGRIRASHKHLAAAIRSRTDGETR